MYRSILQILIFQPDIRLGFYNHEPSNQSLKRAIADGYDAAGKALTPTTHARGRLVHEVA